MIALFAGAVGCGVLIVALAILVWVLYLLQTCFQRIPQQYRLMEPGMVWLMLIPLFNLVWQFFVVFRLSHSFQNYFTAQGRKDVGDCGWTMGLVAMILGLCGIIPKVGALASLASLVLWIIYMVKVVGLRNQIGSAPGFPVTPTPPPPPPAA